MLHASDVLENIHVVCCLKCHERKNTATFASLSALLKFSQNLSIA